MEYVFGEKLGVQEKVNYDFLINATGPKLAFDMTEWMSPCTHKAYSVCTYDHAEHAWAGLKKLIDKVKSTGEHVKILIGTGHPKAACQGAAFEYILNVEKELVKYGIRDKVKVTWISNENELGNFGMDGMLPDYGGYEMKSSEMVEMVFADRGIKWILGAGVSKIEDGLVHYKNLKGKYKTETAVGRKIYFDFNNMKATWTIIGVTKDFNFQSMRQEVKPLALTVNQFFGSPNSYLLIDTKTTDYQSFINKIETIWKTTNVNTPFEFSFLDKDFEKNYAKESKISTLIRFFTFIALLITCLGLFGLATFTIQQRTKEIGIRKVLGANMGQIVGGLSTDLIKPVAISILIASPLAYYGITKWLGNFAYKIQISWWVFLSAALITISIAFFTVSFQAIKASLMNPVKSLKTE